MSTTIVQRILENDQFVWDSGTMGWVKMTQPAAGGGGDGTVDQGAAGASPWLVTGPLTDTQLRAADVKVSLDGETVALTALPALVAGSAIVGKVGIDQTTPGVTNKVSVGADVVHAIVDSGSLVVTQPTAANLNVTEASAAGIAVDTSIMQSLLTGISANQLPPVLGALTSASSLSVVPSTSASFNSNINAIAGAAPAVSSGLKTSGTLRVVIATDQPSLTNPLAVTASAGANLNTSALALEASQLLGNASLTTLAGAIKTEDAVATDADTGIVALAVRQDTPLATTSASGDYTGLTTDAQGRLWTNNDVARELAQRANDLLLVHNKLLAELMCRTAAMSGAFVPYQEMF